MRFENRNRIRGRVREREVEDQVNEKRQARVIRPETESCFGTKGKKWFCMN
jgi:hypothetical protein